MDDLDLLRTEINWTRPPGARGKRMRPPPGVNAITAFGIVYTLLLWLLTVFLFQGVRSGPPGSGVVDPMSIVALVVMGVEMLVAHVLAAKTWVAIGPGPRAILRPIGVLGPWPVLLIGGFTTLMIVGYTYALLTGQLFQQRRAVATPKATPTATIAATTTPGATTTAVAIASPSATPTPARLTVSQGSIARKMVLEVPLKHVRRPDELGDAMKHDLVRLGVPVRAVALVAPAAAGKDAVPFELTIDYVSSPKPETRARHYWMIVAMTGRRASELGLNLKSITVRTFDDTKETSRTAVSPETAKAVFAGSAVPAEALAAFTDLR